MTKEYTKEELNGLTARELYDICKELQIKNYTSFKKDDLKNEIVLVSRGEKKVVRKNVAENPKLSLRQ